MATSNKDFRVKNGLVVEGTTATVNGNNVLTESSSINSLSDVDTSGKEDGSILLYNSTNSLWSVSKIEGALINIDGGDVFSTYGGVSPLNAGGV